MTRCAMCLLAGPLLSLCFTYARAVPTYAVEPLATQQTLPADKEPCGTYMQARLEGSGDPFAAEALVAGGGSVYGSGVHRAEVRLTTSPPACGEVFVVRIRPGEGLGHRRPQEGAHFLGDSPAARTREVLLTTGGDGTACTTYVSGNVAPQTVTLELLSPGGTLLDTATIHQAWDDDAGLEFNCPDVSVPGIPGTFKFTCRLREGVPIDGHDIPFYISGFHLVWYERNLDTGEIQTGENTFKKPFSSLPLGLKLDDLFTVSATVETLPGVYCADITPHYLSEVVTLPEGRASRDVSVHRFDLGVYDTGVLVPGDGESACSN